jgi:hypothetical protein
MMFFPINDLSSLSTKPIFACTDWSIIWDSNDFPHRPNVTADLLCYKCNKIKTFMGKAYSRYDLGCKYMIENNSLNENSYQPFISHNEDDETLEDMIDERALAVDDSIIAQLRCPTCGSSVYICYYIEYNNKFEQDSDMYRVHKIGEYPNQDINRFNPIQKYSTDFPNEYKLMISAEKAFSIGLGSGSIIYLRKAYESLLYGILDENNISRPTQFRQALEKADEVAHIVPLELKDRAYGLFGEMSDLIHGEAEDEQCLEKYELLRDVFRLLLDEIVEKKRKATLIERIKLDNSPKQSSLIK